MGAQGQLVSRSEHLAARGDGGPRLEITASGHPNEVLRAHVCFPAFQRREVSHGNTVHGQRRRGQGGACVEGGPFDARVADFKNPVRHDQERDSMMRRMSASMRSSTGAVLSGLGAWLKYSEPRMKCEVLSVTKN